MTSKFLREYMLNFALMLPHYSATQYPHCTESSAHHSDTDCGSTAWAFSLFIAWNILSMVSLGMRHFVLGRQN